MKNVLIITYYFPPRPAVGGLRLYGLAKYFPQYGWNPIILTAILPGDPDPQFTVIQTPYDDVVVQWKKRLGLNPNQALTEQFNVSTKRKRLLSIVERIALISSEIIAYPDGMRGWYDHAVLAGDKILKAQKIDAIISSSSPVTSHLIAKVLSEKYQIPWVADLRDLWTQNHYFQYSRIRRFFERELEIKTFGNANALTTVSQPLVDKLKFLHKSIRILSIPNGFDPDQINPRIPLIKKFNITYTGFLYKNRQDPELLFQVLGELIDEKNIDPQLIEVNFFGYDTGWLKNDGEKNQLHDFIKIHGMISREDSILRQRESQILLLLTWNDPKEPGIYTGKLFDYLAARRPILSIGYTDGGVVKELLDQTQAGVHCSNEAELREYLLKAYREYKELGAVQYHGIEAEVMKYSHREMARKFAEVLEEVTGERGVS